MTAIIQTKIMAVFFIMTLILLIFVTPFSVNIRTLFNSLRFYAVTNLSIVRFLLLFKFRLKIEDNNIYYSINNKDIKKFVALPKTQRIDVGKITREIYIDEVNIKISYGVKDNAMRTALESALIKNILLSLKAFIKIDNLNVEVQSRYDKEIISVDLNIHARFALMQILIMAIRILLGRRKEWKTLKT